MAGGGATDAMIGLLSHLTRAETRINQKVWVTTYDFEGLRDHIRTWDPALKIEFVSNSESL